MMIQITGKFKATNTDFKIKEITLYVFQLSLLRKKSLL